LAWLDKFKQVGDVAVNFDPHHAALPWAGVRLMLEVCRDVLSLKIYHLRWGVGMGSAPIFVLATYDDSAE
jgi:hypothetical protein